MDKNCSSNSTLSSIPYDIPLHILGLASVFFFSGIGVLGTIFLSSRQNVRNNRALFVLFLLFKLFGIGVIGATAWIHILPDAFKIFSDECFDDTIWQSYGTNWVGAFAITSSFVIQMIEFGFISKRDQKELRLNSPQKNYTDDDHEHGHGHGDVDEQDITALKDLGTYSLEAGILFHSLVIGIALGVATDEFISLLIAICFHQLFEGIALGIRIGELRTSFCKKIVFGILYPIVTPLGIFIGIIMLSRNNNVETPYSLLFKGIVNSLSAGILVYNTYVELIGMDINLNKEFRMQSTLLKIFCFLFLYIGAAVMAVLAVWA